MDDLHFDQLLDYDYLDMHQQCRQHTLELASPFAPHVDLAFQDLSPNPCYSPDSFAPANRQHATDGLPVLPSMRASSTYFSATPHQTPPQSPPSVDEHQRWLSRLWKPQPACSQCVKRGFECFFLNGDISRCSSCRARATPCSFSLHESRPAWPYVLGDAGDDELEDAALVSPPPSRSASGRGGDAAADHHDIRSSRASSRFPRSTTLVLKRWLDAHAENPYPTDDQKMILKRETALSMNQISNWLANARRRGKVRSRRTSPIVTVSHPNSPLPILGAGHRELDPFERWQHSPPEREAPISLIREAAASTHYETQHLIQSESRTPSHRTRLSGHSSGTSAPRDHSISSFEDKSASPLSSESAHSHASKASRHSPKTESQRRRRKPSGQTKRSVHISEPEKIFQCTFCTDSFHIKYDWVRHEKTQHLTLEKWICHPLGPVLTTSADGRTTCVYCRQSNPDQAHLDSHAHSDCEAKGQAGRTFYRKDHLRQHLRLFHRTPFHPSMDQWKAAPSIIRSRCGICPPDLDTTFTTWQQRADHIAKHYREGANVDDWQGDLGFDPDVSALLTNTTRTCAGGKRTLRSYRSIAQPNVDGQSFFRQPSGPTSYAASPQLGRTSPCWQALTRDLGLYVTEQLRLGFRPSDEMLRRQARLIAFGGAHCTDETSADQTEWLSLFKQAHGLDNAIDSPAKRARCSSTPIVVQGSMGPPPRPRQKNLYKTASGTVSVTNRLQRSTMEGSFRFVGEGEADFSSTFSDAGLWNGFAGVREMNP